MITLLHRGWRVAGCWLASMSILWSASGVFAAPIDTEVLEHPWPRERVRQLEVGRYPVRWRHRASRAEGLFTGVRFEVPLERQGAWELANDYSDIGPTVPGVTAVRFLERSATRQVIQVDVKVLWKKLRLTFEVEQDPPTRIRFRLVHHAVGEYIGVCVFEERPASGTHATGPSTTVELSTWLKPARPVPLRLLLLVERMALLGGVKSFLASCDQDRLALQPAQ